MRRYVYLLGLLYNSSASTLVGNDLTQFFNEVNNQYNPIRPKAFLNYIAFDNQLQMVDANSGVVPVPKLLASDTAQPLVVPSFVIKKSGYIYIYVSNQSAQKVYFDSLTIHHHTGHLLEENQYYPFGLRMAGISDKALPIVPNQYLYQGKALQSKGFSDGSGLGWYDFGARFYDPQIGRWLTPDPKHQYASPYVGMGNNPVVVVDPDGQLAGVLLGMVVGAASGGVYGGLRAVGQGRSILGGMWRGALTGAVGGSIANFGGAGMSFISNLGWGVGEGAATGALGAALWGGNIGKGALWGAATGAVFTTAQSDNFTNAVRGKGFKTNASVFEDFSSGKYTSAGGVWQQDALDYFGIRGIYSPEMVKKHGNGGAAYTDPLTGTIFYNEYTFKTTVDRLNLTADHEMQHRHQVYSGEYNVNDRISRNTAEWKAYMHNYKNQGLYPNHGENLIHRIHVYQRNSGRSTYDYHQKKFINGFESKWWHFIYRIPRRW